MPEEAKTGHVSSTAQVLLDRALRQCKASYSGLTDLLHPESTAAAIVDPESGRSIQHNKVVKLLRSFRLPLDIQAGQAKPIVTISLPNGPLLALTVLATSTYYTAAPVAHGSGVGAEQFKADVLQSKSNMVLATASDVARLGLRDSWLEEAGIKVLFVELATDMSLVVRDVYGNDPMVGRGTGCPTPNTADDIGILLFTSGTSGTKKLVPLYIHSMVCGVAMVIESWGLSPAMRCLDQMPLNHVGGLIRNLLAPLMSGGSVICCSAFDANLFWDCVEDYAPTWYYASPSMHQCILEAGNDRPDSVAKSQIHLVCNAAGGLLPSLACQLRDTFSIASKECTVLPSYGMTECMPISTPPLNYKLEKTGTSGVSVGPEIAILDGRDASEPTGIVGRICVRGAPIFSGYLKGNNVIDKSCFTQNGWFDTGDMGYLDSEGFLYITGRTKEVINRGGELISPFEVEEAVVAGASNPDSLIHGRISKALAFSVTHDVLQEVVGVAVVTPEGSKRACLRGIQESVKRALSQVKVPVLIVYMEGGLPTNNSKILRIKLADRLGLPAVSDDTPQAERHYQAVCPPPNTPLSESIECSIMKVTHDCLRAACKLIVPSTLDVLVRTDNTNFYPELVVAPKLVMRADSLLEAVDSKELIEKLAEELHGYELPLRVNQLEEPLPRDRNGNVDQHAVNEILSGKGAFCAGTLMSGTEAAVATIFAQILAVSANELSSESDFFDLGGDSMKAGRLLSSLRKEFQLRLPIDVLFTNRQVAGLAQLIDSKLEDARPNEDDHLIETEELLPGCNEAYKSNSPMLMFLQLLPLGLFYPMKRALTWTVFMYCLTFSQHLSTNESIPGRLLDLAVSMAIGRAVTKTMAPIIAIMFKWLVIGRYKEGLYPMWNRYHTRWWLCEKVIAIAGKGVFGNWNATRVFYYRCLGAKIGSNVSINKGAMLGEYDLITIEDNAVLERCRVRPFAAERNTSMYLGRVHIGANASVGLASVVAAGTRLPANACVGPNSSSWEVADADEANRDLVASKVPKAHWALEYFVGLPVTIVSTFIGMLPWLGCLVALVTNEPKDNIVDMFREVVIWFASPNRVGFHYAALAANAALGPVFFFGAVYLVKKIFDTFYGGPIQPTDAADQSNIWKFRRQLVNSLMPAPQFHKLSELFGTHYEATSMFARALGAKIGTRVYWPGTGPSVQDWDLLEIGDDVVFGSRSHLVTSDGTGSDKVKIGNGSMVADRVVLLPGVELGNKTVMGSGALTKRDSLYPSDTTWVGSRKNEAICLTSQAQATNEKLFDVGRDVSRPESPYYDTLKAPGLRILSFNSSSTTLVRQTPLDSERSSIRQTPYESRRSSIELVEKGHGKVLFTESDISKAQADNKRRTSIAIHAVAASSEETLAHPSNSAESSTPFGRAFYHGLAPYRVWSQFTIFCYSTFITIATAIYWNIGSISAVQVLAHIFKHRKDDFTHYFLSQTSMRPVAIYALFTALIVAIMALQSLVVIAFIISAKWVLMGRRKQGNYDWDKSPYCQRWQLFLKLEALRRHCYGGQGILGMLTGTEWIVWYFRALGAKIGKDCALFASGCPSLYFTEPDLLTLGDRVAVDDASLVCHINTRGKFDLNPLYVGDRSVLRSGSRLLSGARMENDTCLLEHTLVMAGDVVDAGCTSQGWPAEEFKGSRMPTLKPKLVWAVGV